jgi:hypothetical protein
VRYLTWLKRPQLELAALAATLLDYIAEVDHAHERIERWRRSWCVTRRSDKRLDFAVSGAHDSAGTRQFAGRAGEFT